MFFYIDSYSWIHHHRSLFLPSSLLLQVLLPLLLLLHSFQVMDNLVLCSCRSVIIYKCVVFSKLAKNILIE